MKPFAISSLFAILLGSGALAAGNHMNDDTLNAAIARFVAAGPEGARLRLSEVTDFEWDTVRSYSGTAPITVYRRDLGNDFRLSDEIVRQLTDDSTVLIFLKDGRIVSHAVIGPPVFMQVANGSAREPQHAVLTVMTRDPGPYSTVKFVE